MSELSALKNTKKYFILVILLSLAIGFYFYTKPNVKIITAENNEMYKKMYPKSCFLKFENTEYLIQNIYKYKNGILDERCFLGSEGFTVEKLGFWDIKYSNGQKPSQFLNLNIDNEFLEFDNQNYKIDKILGDTLISKIDANKIIMFIKEK